VLTNCKICVSMIVILLSIERVYHTVVILYLVIINLVQRKQVSSSIDLDIPSSDSYSDTKFYYFHRPIPIPCNCYNKKFIFVLYTYRRIELIYCSETRYFVLLVQQMIFLLSRRTKEKNGSYVSVRTPQTLSLNGSTTGSR
jgi:hypothetical protein